MTIKDRIKDFRRVKASELQANPLNWRTHPESQKSAMRAALEQIGWTGALIVRELPDGSLELIDGHLRTDISGDELVPVLVTDLSEAEALLSLATHDPISAMAEADAAQLDALLRSVETGSEELAKMLDDLAKDAGCEWAKPPEIVEDEVPESPKDPITKPGDLWLLGGHRLLCGDSRNAPDILRVLDGNKAHCIFTDPPYGVSVGAKNRLLNSVQKAGRCLTDIIDDDLTPEQLEAQLLPAMTNIRTTAMADDCTLFVCGPQGGGLGMMMMMMMQKAGLTARHIIIWVKNQPTFSMGRLDYDYQHEPILLTWLKRHKRPMQGEHRTSVWKIDRERKCDKHPTMKPVALYANAYLNNSDKGDNVFDAYAGSGTMFVAAEQTERRAFGIELSPAYCDVIIERWQQLTGGKAQRVEAAQAVG